MLTDPMSATQLIVAHKGGLSGIRVSSEHVPAALTLLGLSLAGLGFLGRK
jgi:hypothetical protein